MTSVSSGIETEQSNSVAAPDPSIVTLPPEAYYTACSLFPVVPPSHLLAPFVEEESPSKPELHTSGGNYVWESLERPLECVAQRRVGLLREEMSSDGSIGSTGSGASSDGNPVR